MNTIFKEFGKNMYAVSVNQEAETISGISLFWNTLFVFIMAGILYGLGGWLEHTHVKGSTSSTTDTAWETNAIPTCVVGDISFSGVLVKKMALYLVLLSLQVYYTLLLS